MLCPSPFRSPFPCKDFVEECRTGLLPPVSERHPAEPESGILSSRNRSWDRVGLAEMDFEDYVEEEVPAVRRLRVEYRRAE